MQIGQDIENLLTHSLLQTSLVLLINTTVFTMDFNSSVHQMEQQSNHTGLPPCVQEKINLM